MLRVLLAVVTTIGSVHADVDCSHVKGVKEKAACMQEQAKKTHAKDPSKVSEADKAHAVISKNVTNTIKEGGEQKLSQHSSQEAHKVDVAKVAEQRKATHAAADKEAKEKHATANPGSKKATN